MSHRLLQSLAGPEINVWGRNVAVGTAMEAIYEFSQDIDFYGVLGTGATLDVTSSSTNDDGSPAGTGAQTIEIVGLDANGNIVTETVTMNGRTAVETTTTFTDVFGVDVASHGTLKKNDGDIYVIKHGTSTWTNGVPDTITSGLVKVLAGWNTATTAHWKCPTNGGMYRLDALCASSHTQAATLHVIVVEPGETDKTGHTHCVFGLPTGSVLNLDAKGAGITLKAGQALVLKATGAASGAVVHANFRLVKVQ